MWQFGQCKNHILFQARIKKIMQIDEDVGKVAAAVPVIISRDQYLNKNFFCHAWLQLTRKFWDIMICELRVCTHIRVD